MDGKITGGGGGERDEEERKIENKYRNTSKE